MNDKTRESGRAADKAFDQFEDETGVMQDFESFFAGWDAHIKWQSQQAQGEQKIPEGYALVEKSIVPEIAVKTGAALLADLQAQGYDYRTLALAVYTDMVLAANVGEYPESPAPAAVPEVWNLIETAPTDRPILVREYNDIYKAQWNSESGCWSAFPGQPICWELEPEEWAEIPGGARTPSEPESEE